MGILFRYVFREVLASSLLGATLFTFVLFLQRVGPVMELLVRATVSSKQVGYLFLLTIPQSLPYTIPMGVLLGVLIGLGRLSTDAEITAMRAGGVPSGRIIAPVLAFCLMGAAACAWVTLELSPWSARELQRIAQTMKISQATAEVQPRVFVEDFPDTVLYVREVESGSIVSWKGVFIADMRPPEKRGSVEGVNAAVAGPRITVAETAVAVPRPEQNRIQLHLPHATTFEQSWDPKQYQIGDYHLSDQVIETQPDSLENRDRPFEEMETSDLRKAARDGDNRIQAGIVLHQRLALPIACLVLPLAGIPLSISTQRTGKSVGVVVAVVLAFVYWMLLFAGAALAEQHYLPPGLSMWLGNFVFAACGLWLLSQLDSPSRRDITAWIGARLRPVMRRIRRRISGKPQVDASGNAVDTGRSIDVTALFDALLPLVDRYVLRKFLLYFGVMLATFISIWFVFSFFELLSDMLARGKMALFIPYIYYLTPFLVYETAPLAVLVATLASFGLLAKHHELTAFRACGVSLYRLAAPILLASLVFSGGLFALDEYYLPNTNRKQDAIRDEIKGRPARTFLRPDRQWTHGLQNRIFYHQFFDTENAEFIGINIYDLALDPFRLTRHISAERAHWDPDADTWVFENGWVREIEGNRPVKFEPFQERSFPDIVETPEYFRKENKHHQQMNWGELHAYILDLTQSGFDTMRLQVLLHRKLSFPFFAFSMALLAAPFAILTGHRGALAPVAFSLALAIVYYALREFFEKLGQAHQLSPLLAAWAPSVIFSLSGAYLFLRVRT